MNKKGFTLIELLIVVVIIGILAAIAIPRFSQTRERAFVSSMQSDLRNLQTIQEQFYADGYTYAANNGALVDDDDNPMFAASTGVTVTIEGGGGQGWSAVATHDGLDGTNHCGIAVGTATNTVLAGAVSGQIACNVPGVLVTTVGGGDGEGGGG